MTNAKHTQAMTHYDNCAADAWGDIKTAMVEMRPLYDAAPDLLAALECIIDAGYMDDGYPPTLQMALDAIKSAKGE